MTGLKHKEFTKDDCLKLKSIYDTKKKGTFTPLYYLGQSTEKMEIELNRALCKYKIDRMDNNSPTETKLKAQHKKALNPATNLRNQLRNYAEDYHFWAAIVSAKAGGQAYYEIDDKIHDKILQEIEEKVTALDQSLKWFTDSISPCLEEDFRCWDAKDSTRRKKPETQLIQDLSKILTKHCGKKGYSRGDYSDPNSATGWRIDCLDYLLKRVEIPMKRNQILEAVTAS